MVRPGVLEAKYHYEYEIGQWTFPFGTLQAVREKASGLKRICKTISKLSFLHLSSVRHEISQLQKLRHPNICGLIECLEDEACFHLIVDCCEGGDVSDLQEKMGERAWFDERTVAVYIQQLLVATAHCHSARIYHRDLKPASMGLTSKLPDASIKVMDFGLAAIFDPNNMIVKETPSLYVAPELLSGHDGTLGWASDMWSIGAIAYSMLVNEPPYRAASDHVSSAWEMGNVMRGPLRFFQDDGWAERSVQSRNFIRSLLCPAANRATAAQALQHPWLRKFAVVGVPKWPRAPGEAAGSGGEVEAKVLVYTLTVLLAPLIVSHQDCEKLRSTFLTKDADQDGYLAYGVAGAALRDWGGLTDEAIAGSLDAADVFGSGVFDLCGFLVAHVLSVNFPGVPAGEELVRILQDKVFDAFGDPRSGGGWLTVSEVSRKIKTNTMRQLEAYANVRYFQILGAVPPDRPVDKAMLASSLLQARGTGTPLGVTVADDDAEAFTEGDLDDSTWASRLSFDSFMMCGQHCTGGRREPSPYSLRIY